MKKRLLLVEDHHIQRLLAQDFFEHKGYVVKGLQDGSQFFDTLNSFQPHLVLLDLNLPGQDGFSLLEALQQSPWRTTPVIVVSAYAFEQERQRASQLGIRHFCAKPIHLEQLNRAIEAELSALNPDSPAEFQD